jgi:hypothetical protein
MINGAAAVEVWRRGTSGIAGAGDGNRHGWLGNDPGRRRTMAQRGRRAPSRAETYAEPDHGRTCTLLRERRWRILRAVLPRGHRVDPLPTWVRTPEQFAACLVERESFAVRAAYFADLEEVARQTCDLELLRLARKYRP